MEIEAQMAEDKEREAQRVAKVAAAEGGGVGRAMTGGGGRPATGAGSGPGTAMTAVRRIATQGAVRRPVTPRVGRGGGF